MRSLALSAAATLTMGLLLTLIFLRAGRELLGWKRLPCVPAAAPLRPRRLTAAETAAVFLAPLVLLWLGTLAAYLSFDWTDKTLTGFFSLWRERFTTAGDAPHYLYLAEHGYAHEGEKINLIVFYPLYPFLTGLLGRLLGGRYALAGILISQSALGGASLLLCHLARQEGGESLWTLLAFWLYPQAFFALGVFTEGLFLLLFLSCLLCLRREKWLWAGLWGALALLCRAQGITLLPVFVYALWHSARKKGWSWRMLAVLALPLGWGVYLLLNRIYAGDFFAFRLYESLPPWWQTTQWLGKTIAQQADMAQAYPWLGKIIYLPQLFLYFLAAALLTLGFFRGLSSEALVCSTGYLGMCYLAGWLISGGRYMFGCVGLYLTAGLLRSKGSRWLLLAGELAAGLWFLWNFMAGESIM